jgi:hypothetical protein
VERFPEDAIYKEVGLLVINLVYSTFHFVFGIGKIKLLSN